MKRNLESSSRFPRWIWLCKFHMHKIAHVSTTDYRDSFHNFPGAMENWGLITYEEALLLLDEESGSVREMKAVAISLLTLGVSSSLTHG
jgi:hypothetical protein